MLGPIDYIVVGFKGNNFDGSVLSELSKAIKDGAIRVVDLIFVIKDEDGAFAIAEIEDQDEDLQNIVKPFELEKGLQLLAESDVEKIASAMDNDTSAGVLVIEQLWAKGLKKALIDAGARLLDEGRIHPDVVKAAAEELENVNVGR